MSLDQFAMVSDVSEIETVRDRRLGGPPASKYLLMVDPVDPQLPLNCAQRHALASGFLHRFPSLLLKEGRLTRSDGCSWRGSVLTIGDALLIRVVFLA